MPLKIFKFGGASVKDKEAIENVGQIIRRFSDDRLVVVVSALGKTTNALEEVVHSYYKQDKRAAALLHDIKNRHFDLCRNLNIASGECLDELNDIFVEAEWVLDDIPHEDFDYTYDQIVSVGELASSKILAHYLRHEGLNTTWLDIRNVILTDNTYRDARIQWNETVTRSEEVIEPLLNSSQLCVTQGFIGSTSENFTTTLGREGSDYTAAILAFCLNADSMHIWKDVPGVLTGDPRLFDNAIKMPRLTYKEAIEMTYYGAKVIHPKTIKPLQNKSIPLYVRPFSQPSSEGTIICDDIELSYPPVIVIEPQQVLIHISTRDFSFVAEHHLSRIFSLLAKHRLKVNVMKNSAISFSVCIHLVQDRIDKFIHELGKEFKVVVDENLELITIRHYNDSVLQDMKSGKLVILEEKLKDTVQLVVSDLPQMVRKHQNTPQ